MRKQLELDGIPRKRVSLITEPANALKEEPVVQDEYTEWFRGTIPPAKEGYWEVRPPGGEVDRKVWFNSARGWAWPFLNTRQFEWRGLKAPPQEGYPYHVEGAKRLRPLVLTM